MTKIRIDEDLTQKIARLARLKLTSQEKTLFTKDLQKILDYIEQLGEVKTEGVEPINHGYPLAEHYREDVAIQLSEEETREIVACSEGHLYDQFRVPQVIGGES